MGDRDRKKLRLSRAKKGLVEGLTKLVHDAAGELVSNALSGLEESPLGRAASAITLPVSGGRTESFGATSSRVCNGQITSREATLSRPLEMGAGRTIASAWPYSCARL